MYDQIYTYGRSTFFDVKYTPLILIKCPLIITLCMLSPRHSSPVTTTALCFVLQSSCSCGWLQDYPFRQFWHTWRYSAFGAESAGLDPRVDFFFCSSSLSSSLLLFSIKKKQSRRNSSCRYVSASAPGSIHILPSIHSTPSPPTFLEFPHTER